MPFSLAKAGNIWRWLSPGGAPTVLPSRSFGLVERLLLPAEDVERRLVEHHADHLDGGAAADRGDHHRGVGQARVGAAGVDLGDRIARALGVLQGHVEALGLVVALVERHPVGGVVADREPVEREGELLLRRGAAGGRQAARPARVTLMRVMIATLPFRDASPNSVDPLGPRRPAPAPATTTTPYSSSPTTEIQISAANATDVFMLLWVVTIT